MRVYIYPNRFNEEQIRTAGECIRILTANGISCGMPDDLYTSLQNSVPFTGYSVADCDAVASVGGDGSVLRAARIAVPAGKPLFGINDGHVGFLCRFSLQETAMLTEDVLRSLKYEERTLISFIKDGKHFFALNDIVIAKTDFSTAIRISAALDGVGIGKWHGDGIIVATPTGSTAYNRSAGGPKLMADSHCFVLTPICSYSSPSMPIVYPDTGTLDVKIEDSVIHPYLYADGVSYGRLENGITIERYAESLRIAVK